MKELFCFLLITLSLISNAQGISSSERLQKINENRFLDFDIPLEEAVFFERNSALLGLEASEMQLLHSREVNNQFTFNRYQQFYKGLKVKAAQYILHLEDNKVKRSRGTLVPFLNLNTKAKLDKNKAFLIAQEAINNELLRTQSIPINAEITWRIKKQNLVVMDRHFPDNSGQYVLAHEIRIQTDAYGELDYTLCIHANDGHVLHSSTNIHSGPIEGTHKTFYYGEQSMVANSVDSGNFELLDETRNSMQTIDASNGKVVSNNENKFDTDSNKVPYIAADAHYCTAKYHDYMADYFNWEGVDGFGSPLLTRINQGGKYYTNATWNGTYASFGNGSCDTYNPLTILDVVAHEYAHGFVQFTSGLIYYDQSGALNESVADIFGKTVEFKNDPNNFSWNLGIRAAKREDITGFRSMNDPHSKNDPKYYGGQYWYTGKGDNAGVHTNSGVLNYWYYMLVEGETGVNEAGINYDVVPIGMDDAMTIIYAINVGNLTENSNYFDAYYASIDQATSIFGEFSQQLESIEEAWKAVGIYDGINAFDLKLEPIVENIGFCPGDVTSMDVIVRNVGIQSFATGDQFDLSYNLKGTNYTEVIQLNNLFSPGDSIVYTLSNPIENIQNATERIDINLSHSNDLNLVNNNVQIIVRSSEVSGVDVKLNNFRLVQDRICGQPEITAFSYTIQNKGCTPLNTGDVIVFNLDAGSEILSFSRELFFDFEPGVYQGGYVALDDPVLANFKDFVVSIEVPNDLIPENNDYASSISYTDIITNGYFENFDPVVDKDFFYSSSNQYYGVDSIVEYQDNYVMAFTGQRQSASFINCADLEDFFDSYYYRSTLRYCVDTEGMAEPIFSFDLTQLYNDEFATEISDLNFRSILRVHTESDTSDFYYGLPEGEMNHIEFELDSLYAGPLEIQVIALSGQSNPFIEGDIEKSDAALIDNIRFYDRFEEDQKFMDREFILYPNPAADQFTVQSKSPNTNYDILVTDELGRYITEFKNNQFFSHFDASNFSSGLYIISIIVDDEKVAQHKLVITH